MSTDKTPLVNKLMLIVLVLILGCLMILVVEQDTQRRTLAEPSSVIADPIEEFPTRRRAEAISYLPVTNRSIAKPQLTSSAPRPPLGRVANRGATGIADVGQPVLARPIDNLAEAHSAVAADALGSSYGGMTTAQAGISGRVWLTGTPPPEIPIKVEGTFCGLFPHPPLTTRHYVVTQDGALANVFVYVKDGLQNAKFPVPTNQPVIDNKGCLFEPYVMGLQANQKLKVQNSDPILHNFHALFSNCKDFNAALQAKDFSSGIRFNFPSPEVFVRVKCDVHPWMFAYIGVVPHPFFAVTDAEGAFRFPPGLPEGKYRIAAVHPKAGESVQEITLAANEARVLNFNLAVPNP